MYLQWLKYLCTSKYYKYIKYIAWYLSISTSTMATFKRYSSTNVLDLCGISKHTKGSE